MLFEVIYTGNVKEFENYLLKRLCPHSRDFSHEQGR